MTLVASHVTGRRLVQSLLGLLVLLALAGCTTRPSPAILRPMQLQASGSQTVQVLVATNRGTTPDGGFTASRAAMSYERYTISVPANTKAGEVVYPSAAPAPEREYVVLEREALSPAQFLTAVSTTRSAREPTSLFVHGYNQSYQEALFRLAQVGADANFRAPMILFTWPSEADLFGYVADKDAVLASRSDLAGLIQDIAQIAPSDRFFVFGHSMGGFLLMEALRELRMSGRDRILDGLSVALAAPDIDVAVFGAQLETIGRLREPITVLVSRRDRALEISSLLGSDRPRIGRLDVQNPTVQALVAGFDINVVDITALESPDRFGHDGYASLAQHAQRFSQSQTAGLASAVELGFLVFSAPRAALMGAGVP